MKKILNKLKHNTLFGIIIGIVLCSGVVYAISYSAKDISYVKKDGSQINVNEALDSLYDINNSKEILETGKCTFGELGYENTSSWSTVTFSKSYTAEDNVYLIVYQIDQSDAWTNIYVRGTGKVTGNSKNLQITNKGSVNSPGATIHWALIQMS